MPITVATCPSCSGVGAPDARAAAYLGLKEPFGVQRCNRCSMRWQSPRPSLEEFEVLYQGAYHTSDTSGPPWLADYPAPPEAVRRGSAAATSYVSAQQAHYLELLKRHLPDGGSLIEVGCSNGDFLTMAKEAGWAVAGIEPSESAANIARSKGLNVHTGTYEHHLHQMERPDAIFLGHVFEHLDQPTSAARSFYDALPHGGVLCLEVPNQFDSAIDRVGRVRQWLRPTRKSTILSIHHVNFFGPKSLHMALVTAGFDVTIESWSPRFPSAALRILDAIGSRCGNQGRNLQAICRKV